MKRAIWGIAAMIGVVAVGLVASLVAGDPAPEGLATVAASGPSAAGGGVTTTSSTSSNAVSAATTITTTTTTTARATTTAAPTTVASTRPPTTATPITTATTAVTATTTTTVDPYAAPGPVCASSMFTVTVTMSKPAYRVGETVQATSVFRNVSGQTCHLTSTREGFKVLDAGGEPATLPVVGIGDYFRWVAAPAGETESNTWTWDQQVCRPSVSCVAAAPGRYTFVVDVQPYGSGRATFDITA